MITWRPTMGAMAGAAFRPRLTHSRRCDTEITRIAKARVVATGYGSGALGTSVARQARRRPGPFFSPFSWVGAAWVAIPHGRFAGKLTLPS